MKVVVQRCSCASVLVNNEIVGTCENGLVLLVGFTTGDSEKDLDYMVKKIVNLRIFPDEDDVMNKSLLDVNGSILSVSQFTLYADTKKGNRPSYIRALGGSEAKVLYDLFNQKLKEYTKVETGVFGSSMEVTFTNMGPTTIILESN